MNRTFLRRVASAFIPFYEFVFPPRCFACGAPIDSRSGKVCHCCLGALHAVLPGDPLFRETLLRLHDNGHVSGLFALYHFEELGPLQTLVHQLKYGGARIVGEMMGLRLGEVIRDVSTEDGILVPVPLHRSKMRERGYNQAACICRGMARVLGWPVCPRLVARRKYTASQTKLNILQRRENVKGAFRVRPASADQLMGKDVYLVDDVITTGATMGECAESLLRAGAANVYACAIALAG